MPLYDSRHKGAGAELAREMAEMRVKVTASGHEQYGVWREGEHDDLVLAVALACWAARKAHPGEGSGYCTVEGCLRLPGM